jgi:hypothetical protein
MLGNPAANPAGQPSLLMLKAATADGRHCLPFAGWEATRKESTTPMSTKSAFTPVGGTWARETRGQADGDVQEEVGSARLWLACGVFTVSLLKQPEQPRFRT